MKQTSKFKLNLVEASDSMSMKPLNENTNKIESAILDQRAEVDAILSTHQASIAGRLVPVCGRYTGDGKMSVAIETPGIRPCIVLVYSNNAIGASQDFYVTEVTGPSYFRKPDVSEYCVWHMWDGRDIATKYYEEYPWGDEYRYQPADAEIRFTPSDGGLQWKLSEQVSANTEQSVLVNNCADKSYEWIAFGTAV